MNGVCNFCSKSANLNCSNCQGVFYCDKSHQKLDWKVHKSNCVKYKIGECSSLGRYMVASRDIKAGEVILKENPLAYGPKTASYPVCLGCDRLLTDSKLVRCPECHWPICGLNCKFLENHRKECRIMNSVGYRNTIPTDGSMRKIESCYCCITPLRCLLLDKSDRDKLLALQSHLDELIDTPLYRIHRQSLVPFVRNVLNLDFTEQTILRVAGILDTNCFEVKVPGSSNGVKIRALYPKAAMMSHDCYPNAKHRFDVDGNNRYRLTVLAATEIAKGTVISITYTQTLWPTRTRIEHLKKAKQFLCHCARCLDATELSSYLGSYLCNACDSYIVSTSPLDVDADWKCLNCVTIYKAKSVTSSDEYWSKRIGAALKDNRELNLDVSFEQVTDDKLRLHQNNTHIVQARYALLQLRMQCLQDLSKNEINFTINDCQKLCQIAAILEPKMSNFNQQLLTWMKTLKNTFETSEA